MARANFGGSVDYSSFFASLYEGTKVEQDNTALSKLQYEYAAGTLNATEYASALRALAETFKTSNPSHYYDLLKAAENAEKSAEKAEGGVDDQQYAADQDMADQWQNGLVSNETWLAYIAERVATTTDPKEHEQWVEVQRKYTESIAESEAELAYKAGGSINDLVAFYQTKLTRLDSGSQLYDETQGKVNELIDQRTGTQLQEGAQAIIDRINTGKASNEELLAFYKSQARNVRPGTDLDRQLKAEMASLTKTIATNKTQAELAKLQYQYDAGKLSGKAMGAAIRKIAAGIEKSDPEQFYKYLSSAVAFEKVPGLKGSGGGGGGSNVKSINKTIDAIQAQQNLLWIAVDANKKGRKTFVDPATKQTVALTPALIRSIDLQMVDSFDALHTAYYAKGDTSAGDNALQNRSNYVTDYVQPHNQVRVEESYQALLNGTARLIASAAADPDPERALSRLQEIARTWTKYANNLAMATTTKTTTVQSKRFGGEGGVGETTQGSVPRNELSQFPNDFVAQATAIAGALTAYTDPNIGDAGLQGAIDALPKAFGGAVPKEFQNSFFMPAATVNANREGLLLTEAGLPGGVARVGNPNGSISFVPTATASRTALDPATGQFVTVKTQQPVIDINPDAQKLVQGWVEINGTPTPVTLVGTIEPVMGLKTWASARSLQVGVDATGGVLTMPAGHLLTDAMISWMDKYTPDWRRSGDVEQVDAMSVVRVTMPAWTDAQGKRHAPTSWVQDAATPSQSGTGEWYQDSLPLRGIARRADGTVGVNESGSVQADWRAFASASGVSNPFAGSSAGARALQALQDAGKVDLSGVTGHRDATGAVVYGPDPSLRHQYYDPITEANDEMRDTWWKSTTRNAREAQAKLADIQKTRALPSKLSPGLGEEAPAPKPDTLFSNIVGTISGLAQQFGVSLGQVAAAPAVKAPTIPVNPYGSVGGSAYTPPAPRPPVYSGPIISPATGFTLPTSVVKPPTAPVLRPPSYYVPLAEAAAEAAAVKAPIIAPKPVVPSAKLAPRLS